MGTQRKLTSKNISITEDVYKLLTRMKLKDESFSQTIRRLAKRSRLSEYAGLWSDIPEAEFNEIREGIEQAKGLSNRTPEVE
jgi:predicted CopG family antitoxin